ncbi:MAG: glycoside hydrolase, partial [Actinobacteria bacterium]|nr:glycoside hydrolase [Actinomycetota bacterium]
MTDWGDNGHWQPLPVSLPSMVRGGFAAWDGEVPEASVVAGLVDDVAGFDPGVGAMLDRLGSVGEDLG